ncbi:hypothetical protein, conserved [Thermococcus kodakarensis KOD1]|uniref:Uncharacterized protein n=1 Tax=Thermococcus kodakarensis (strain ATCC BAA-918 / JCM 12380 / KOD1) TaxID=69014 RepID=Q5JGF9_THEKO|nr:hypothetical protein [Thermococcus kodakarensis]WCN27215.1 hypothetical protein POG15_06095 [Thermococcus kodakarensis]WCN29501.1 hypothetical protein POG21_06090 [Thermococcus kodakarensis]BAD85390.1 hypothetical protein, conserved [Thermococcus kodakarensis KOD1]
MITMRTKDWKSISGTILVLIAVALVVISAGCSKGPNTENTPTSTSVENTSMSSTQDSTLMLKLNGTFSGQLSVPASLAEEVREYFEKSNTTLYSFEVEVVNDNGKPQASITLYLLKIVPPFEPKDFEVLINGKPVSRETYVPVYEDVPVVIEYSGKQYPRQLTAKVKEKSRARFTAKKSELDKHPGETIKLGTVEGFALLAHVNDAGNYTFIVKGRNGEELATGGLVVG